MPMEMRCTSGDMEIDTCGKYKNFEGENRQARAFFSFTRRCDIRDSSQSGTGVEQIKGYL